MLRFEGDAAVATMRENQAQAFAVTLLSQAPPPPPPLQQYRYQPREDSEERRQQARHEALLALTAYVEYNTVLTTLDLSDNAVIGVNGVAAIAVALRMSKTLTTLELRRNGLSGACAVVLADALKVNRVLTRLDLSENEIDGEGTTAIADALRTNSELLTLQLSSNPIEDSGAAALGEALQVNVALTTLDLSHCRNQFRGVTRFFRRAHDRHNAQALRQHQPQQPRRVQDPIGAASARAFAVALTVNRVLKTLHLEGHEMGDDGAKQIGHALTANMSLTALHLRGNNIAVAGVMAIGEGLAANSTLTTLDLSHNSIRNRGAKYIADALRVNCALTHLNVSGNIITKGGAQLMVDALRLPEPLSTSAFPDDDVVEQTLASKRRMHDSGIMTAQMRVPVNTTLHCLELSPIWRTGEWNVPSREPLEASGVLVAAITGAGFRPFNEQFLANRELRGTILSAINGGDLFAVHRARKDHPHLFKSIVRDVCLDVARTQPFNKLLKYLRVIDASIHDFVEDIALCTD